MNIMASQRPTFWARPRALGALNTPAVRSFCRVDRRTLGRMIASQRAASFELIACAVYANEAVPFAELFEVRRGR
jgi:hypothetical protein